MNLFIELHESKFGSTERRFATGWENLFTEQFAFFLAADLAAATSLAHLFLGEKELLPVTGVSTQPSVTQGTPDLRFDFEDGTHLHVEHNFDAPLGHEQLQRYLRDGKLVLVSHCSQVVPHEVLACGDYLRPLDRHYFDWRDVYGALPSGTEAPEGFGALRDHFRGYMRELGLAPSDLAPEWRRLFEDRADEQNRIVQKEFGRLLDPVKHVLRDLGFRVGNVSHKGKQAYSKPGAWWRHLYVMPSRVRADYLDASDVAPFDPGYEGLVVELVCDTSESKAAWSVYEILRSRFTDSGGHIWYAVKPRPIIGTKRLRVSLATPLVPFLNSRTNEEPSTSALEALDRLLALAGAVVVQGVPPDMVIEPSSQHRRNNSRWSWRECPVDPAAEHIEIRYGDATRDRYEQWVPVALVGRPKRRTFPVRWLIGGAVNPEIISEVRQELDFYLVEHPKGDPATGDPWGYAVYHCGTAANMYSKVHWSYFPSGQQGEGRSSMVVQLSAEGAAQIFCNHKKPDEPHGE